ncbi:hypothetical protein AAFF_G00042080 [Aldrovandia affinis]|uniref:Uncharacterized protein n=1 Tax=Aldrovandia affinis TaxID=143900 RepID=A0AAD7S2P5_9TELE|nr:hypothetical protein AAFF_G00042080 [Aldrovandia affinis]
MCPFRVRPPNRCIGPPGLAPRRREAESRHSSAPEEPINKIERAHRREQRKKPIGQPLRDSVSVSVNLTRGRFTAPRPSSPHPGPPLIHGR